MVNLNEERKGWAQKRDTATLVENDSGSGGGGGGQSSKERTT